MAYTKSNNNNNATQPVSDEKIDSLLKRMIEQIKEAVADGRGLPWTEPYFVGYMSSFVNPQDKKDFEGNPYPKGRPYSGIINPLFLLFGAEDARKRNGNKKIDHRFVRRSSIFCDNPTYKIHRDAVVKKGAKAIFVFIPIKNTFPNKDFDATQPVSTTNPKTISLFTGRWGGGYVFNVADTNLVEIGYYPALDETETKDNPPIDELERVICGYPQNYEAVECIPHYSPSTKMIKTPPIENAKSALAHYGTRCHELIHQLQDMSGDLGNLFDRESYSRHELEAEMGAAYVLGSLGYVNTDMDEFHNSAAYVQTWLQRLTENPRILFDAATMATNYGNLILKGKLPYKIVNREAFTFLPKESDSVSEAA